MRERGSWREVRAGVRDWCTSAGRSGGIVV